MAFNCLNCGKGFEVHPYRKDSAKFCSRECQWESKWKNSKGENNPNWKGKVTLNCLTCAKKFEVYPYLKDKAKFCSNKCRSEEIILDCLNCNKKFRVYPYLKNKAKFCSTECKNQYRIGKKLSPKHIARLIEGRKNASFKIQKIVCLDCEKTARRTWAGQVRCVDCALLHTRKRESDWEKSHPYIPTVPFICKYCKKNIKVFSYRIKQGVKYCSTSCGAKAQMKELRKKLESTKICEYCEQKFVVMPHNDKQKFCSNQCRNLGLDRSYATGENSWNWNGGITDLQTKIRKSLVYKQWRILNLERDDYTCQICNEHGGILNVDHYPKTFSYLLREYNIQSLDDAYACDELWDLNNSRTLCVNCHKKTETYLNPLAYLYNGEQREGYFGER